MKEVDVVSEVFFDEVAVLSEGDVSVMVSVKLLENPNKIFSRRFNSDVETRLDNQSHKFLKTDSGFFPNSIVVALVSSLENDFDKIDRKNYGDKLFESDSAVFANLKVEVVEQEVINLVAI